MNLEQSSNVVSGDSGGESDNPSVWDRIGGFAKDYAINYVGRTATKLANGIYQPTLGPIIRNAPEVYRTAGEMFDEAGPYLEEDAPALESAGLLLTLLLL